MADTPSSVVDLVLRGGTVVDGTGADPRTADVWVAAGRIAGVGRFEGTAKRTIDADGALVTPGFCDMHTHYDGQASWDAALAPSTWHGVTTVGMGNCGVGFAPVRPTDHERLIALMEGSKTSRGPRCLKASRGRGSRFPSTWRRSMRWATPPTLPAMCRTMRCACM